MSKQSKPIITMPPPTVKAAPRTDMDDPELLAMIEGGGSVAAEKKNKPSKAKQSELAADTEDQAEIKNFSIRLLASELADIKDHLQASKTRFKKQSIHSFILEAIAEKLKRERKA